MPQAIITKEDGTIEILEYEKPTPAPVPPVVIERSIWTNAEHTQSVALVGNRWLAYHPTDDNKTHYSIREARTAGVLTGQTTPDEYVAPEAPTLEEVKAAKIAAIDAKTSTLITSGFTWNGFQFSTSMAAQLNWIGIGTAIATGLVPVLANGDLALPIPVSTITEARGTVLRTQADVAGFLSAYMAFQLSPSAALDQGRVLKDAVEACTTVAEVDAIVDER